MKYFGLHDDGQCYCGPDWGDDLATSQQYEPSTGCPSNQIGSANAFNLFECVKYTDPWAAAQASVPFSVMSESPATEKNVSVIDLHSLSSNSYAVSLLVLLVLTMMCVAYQKCSSSNKRTVYAKVQNDDVEIATDEEQELNV